MSKLIPLTKGQSAIVDDADYEWLSRFKWHIQTKPSGKIYADCSQLGRMHRVILSAPMESLVDHKDGNGLNNTRDNLRLCTNGQNLANKTRNKNKLGSRYKGVHLRQGKRPWRAIITVDWKQIYVGSFFPKSKLP